MIGKFGTPVIALRAKWVVPKMLFWYCKLSKIKPVTSQPRALIQTALDQPSMSTGFIEIIKMNDLCSLFIIVNPLKEKAYR